MSKMLYCGKLKYEVTPEVERELESLMYWTFERKLAEGRGIRDDYRQANDTIHTIFEKMNSMGIPNWVGNGAIAFAESHDLRACSTRDFFEKSVYAQKPDIEEIHESVQLKESFMEKINTDFANMEHLFKPIHYEQEFGFSSAPDFSLLLKMDVEDINHMHCTAILLESGEPVTNAGESAHMTGRWEAEYENVRFVMDVEGAEHTHEKVHTREDFENKSENSTDAKPKRTKPREIEMG